MIPVANHRPDFRSVAGDCRHKPVREGKVMFNKPAAFAVPLRRSIGAASVIMALWAAGGVSAMAQTASPASSAVASAAGVTSSASVAAVANPCQRFGAGSVVQNPPPLFSQNGVLNVRFSYQTTTGSAGRQTVLLYDPERLREPDPARKCRRYP
jgi:hypothetical protein